jgi:transcriptional regulator with XRE-family HTH domain
VDTEPGQLPVERITIDQLVAANIRHWRRAAGIKQGELGRRLGWSAANVSSAERSADSSRVARRFNADTLVQLSLALGVPLLALFLPPEDDGERAFYAFTGPGSRELGMADLMASAVMTDTDDDSEVMEAYRHRFREAAGRYLDPEWSAEVSSWLRDIEADEARTERASRLRAGSLALLRAADELAGLADAIAPKADPR